MFEKADIRKISLAVERERFQEVSLALGRESIIHFARFHLEAETVEEGLKQEEAATKKILSGIETIQRILGFPLPPVMEPRSAGAVDTAGDGAFVSMVLGRVDRLQRLRAKIDSEIKKTEERLSMARALDALGIDRDVLERPRFLKAVFGIIGDESWDPERESPFPAARYGPYVFAAAGTRDFPELQRVLKERGFVDRTVEASGLSAQKLEHRVHTLRNRRDVLDSYSRRLGEDVAERLRSIYDRYRTLELVVGSLGTSLFSSRAMFITGWIDIYDLERLEAVLRQICGNRFILSVAEERDPEAPVRLRNSRLLRPFELLVKTMGVPGNDEIDPTPLSAVTFVVMFALMFGDLGQGLVLALAGVILQWQARKKGNVEGTLGQAGAILIICGTAAAFCGLLYGSVFSYEHLLPALWFHPVDNIMSLFAVTILLGAGIIVIGLVLNIINCFMNSRYAEALFDKRGVAVLVPYAAIILLSVRYAGTGEAPRMWETGLFIILPLALFFFRGFIGPLLFGGAGPHSVSEYVIESVVEILEIAMGMLANTISFIRVGAFALSHAGLSIVTYTLAGMIDPSLRSVGAVAVIVIGNIFIIGFEGLICGIQSLRLEYYEFFSKFFRGDGTVFTPFTLNVKASEV
ncbi:MAG: hypothetical protein AVO39_09935 [delta proteobacterium MLS_D]|jgi:V/A-type H+/Na+-transporting ATPase subunit I|nr:MAG: hypothetical protein AVO39_09935 [delta proteobacterium MLS_D]